MGDGYPSLGHTPTLGLTTAEVDVAENKRGRPKRTQPEGCHCRRQPEFLRPVGHRLCRRIEPGHVHRPDGSDRPVRPRWGAARRGNRRCAVLKLKSRDFNLMRECVLGNSTFAPHPGLRPQQAGLLEPGCGRPSPPPTGSPPDATRCTAAGGVDTTSDALIASRRQPWRSLLALRQSLNRPGATSSLEVETSTGSKLVGRLPAALGIEIPTNGEPCTGLSMGEHAAVTAKKMGIKRVGGVTRWPRRATATWRPPMTAGSSTTW